MSCSHERTIVMPDDFKIVGDGVSFSITEGAKFVCADCDQDLPNEDIPLYDKNKMAVAIPKELVDSIDE